MQVWHCRRGPDGASGKAFPDRCRDVFFYYYIRRTQQVTFKYEMAIVGYIREDPPCIC